MCDTVWFIIFIYERTFETTPKLFIFWDIKHEISYFLQMKCFNRNGRLNFFMEFSFFKVEGGRKVGESLQKSRITFRLDQKVDGFSWRFYAGTWKIVCTKSDFGAPSLVVYNEKL